MIVSSYTWRQVVKLVVIVKVITVVILVVWLVVMVVEDGSKVILSTTERGFGIMGMMTRGRWMDTNYIISRGKSLRQ